MEMVKERDVKPVENNEKPKEEQDVENQRETQLPNAYFAAVIAIICSFILLGF
jgi:hypothetical protein